MKKSHFLGDWWFLCDLLCHFWWIFGWDWGTPAILRQYPNIYGHFQGKLGFGQFWKKVGIGSDPPPSLGQNPNFYQKFVLEASLSWWIILNLHSKDCCSAFSTVVFLPLSSSSPSALVSEAGTGERKSHSSLQASQSAQTMPKYGTILPRSSWTWKRQRWLWPAIGRLWGWLLHTSKLWTTSAIWRRPREDLSLPSDCLDKQLRLSRVYLFKDIFIFPGQSKVCCSPYELRHCAPISGAGDYCSCIPF